MSTNFNERYNPHADSGRQPKPTIERLFGELDELDHNFLRILRADLPQEHKQLVLDTLWDYRQSLIAKMHELLEPVPEVNNLS